MAEGSRKMGCKPRRHSMKKTFLFVTLGIVASAFAADNGQGISRPDGNDNKVPEVLSYFWARGYEDSARANSSSHTRSPNMTYHGGKIMPTAHAEAIFWGSSWNDPSAAGDKMTGMDSWYQGFSGSNYSKTSDEYTGTNGQVGAFINYLGHQVDTSTASGGGNASVILAEVCKIV